MAKGTCILYKPGINGKDLTVTYRRKCLVAIKEPAFPYTWNTAFVVQIYFGAGNVVQAADIKLEATGKTLRRSLVNL